MRLYRPVGLEELRLIAEAGYRSFPPRLPEQPIFYPVLTIEYARQIARDWNTKSGSLVGFVTQFDVEDTFVARYPVQVAGSRLHQELWVPAEELAELNRHIVGTIAVVESYVGPGYAGTIDPRTHLPVDWMSTVFEDPGDLVDGDLRLVVSELYPGDPTRAWAPAYRFAMVRSGQKVGSIELRLGATDFMVRFGGQVGYEVDAPFRGHRLAARSLSLLVPLARRHGFAPLWITCDPSNLASRRSWSSRVRCSSTSCLCRRTATCISGAIERGVATVWIADSMRGRARHALASAKRGPERAAAP